MKRWVRSLQSKNYLSTERLFDTTLQLGRGGNTTGCANLRDAFRHGKLLYIIPADRPIGVRGDLGCFSTNLEYFSLI